MLFVMTAGCSNSNDNFAESNNLYFSNYYIGDLGTRYHYSLQTKTGDSKVIDNFEKYVDPFHLFKNEIKKLKLVIDGDRGMVMSSWARTQDVHILNQAFNSGIRYFDLRLTLDPSGPIASEYPFYILHGLVAGSAEAYIRAFSNLFDLDSTLSQEILFLDFNHTHNMTPEDDEFFLTKIIDTMLGQKLIPRVDEYGLDVLTHYTYRDIIKRFFGKNIILLYKDNEQGKVVEKHPEIWYSDYFEHHSSPNKHTDTDRIQIISFWPDSRNWDYTISSNKENIENTYEYNKTVMRVNQFQETPVQKQIEDGIATMVDQALGEMETGAIFESSMATTSVNSRSFKKPWSFILDCYENPEAYQISPNNIVQDVWRKICKLGGLDARFYLTLLEWERSLNAMKLLSSCLTLRESTTLHINPSIKIPQFPFGKYLNIVIVDDVANFSYNKDSACYLCDYTQWENVYDQIETTTYLQMFLVLNGMPYPVKQPSGL